MEEDETLEGESLAKDDDVPYVSYEVTSYGSDPEVEGLVGRLRRGDIIIPTFQRDYVWRLPEASKFIESLLLGLPVPSVFFATDQSTRKQLVIDGQQRLKTLLYFYDGYFNPRPGDKRERVFSLTKVQKIFEGKTYASLEEHDRIRLDTSIMHAITVKQSAPIGDDTSLYHIFERLNSGGRRLTDQEMRVALYHGDLMDRIQELNAYVRWRQIFGKEHTRLKDQELILRFIALFDGAEVYQRPLADFLNKYAGKHQNPAVDFLDYRSQLFCESIKVFSKFTEERPFRPTSSINVAVFDSCMVGLARRLISRKTGGPDARAVEHAYILLLKDEEYSKAVSRSTADATFVQKRISKAIHAFAEC